MNSKKIKKRWVTFWSPGSLFAEQNNVPYEEEGEFDPNEVEWPGPA